MEKRTIQTVEHAISSFSRSHRRMPSYSEMMEILGVKSKAVVHFWINKLLQGGILQKDNKGHLTLTRLSSGLPLMGHITAGLPAPEEEEFRDFISLDEYLVKNPAESFLLKVTGDSMINEGIMEGDMVVVEKGREPGNGDIVLAEVDGEWTMKYFRKQGKQVFLEAANPNYPPIIPRSELRLAGIITAVVRRYHQ